MSGECTLGEIRFPYPRKPKPQRVFVIARQGGEIPKVGDRILGWTEITHTIEPDSFRYESHVLGEWS